jgi:hypothetical protein
VTSRPEVSRPEQNVPYGNQVLTAVARQHAIKDGPSDADLAGYELTPAQRTALNDGDITGPYHLGANPYLTRRVFRAR